MNGAQALLIVAASAVLIVVARQQLQAQPAGGQAFEDDDTAPGALDWLDAIVMSTAATLGGSSASRMSPSWRLLDSLKASEALRLTRYRLGDGGWTIGYGRYYPDGGPLPPERIDRETAERWFAEDVEARGARWVRAYVTADLNQPQFDALTHMAYNLSPRAFRTIAEAVNRGEGPEAAALRYVRAGTHLERGLRNRRAAEFAMFHADPGTYA